MDRMDVPSLQQERQERLNIKVDKEFINYIGIVFDAVKWLVGKRHMKQLTSRLMLLMH